MLEQEAQNMDHLQLSRRRPLAFAFAVTGNMLVVAGLVLVELVAPGPGGGFFGAISGGLLAVGVVLSGVGIIWLRWMYDRVTAALREELSYQSSRDQVTDLYHRRYLERRFPEELARAQRSGKPLALVMVDLDNFKAVNDRLGHSAGDHVLGEVGRAIWQRLRATDMPVRYGGDEFALLLPETGRLGAQEVARRVALAIEELDMAKVAGELQPPMTLSWGVAQFPEDGATVSELVGSADRALYEAKRQRANGAASHRTPAAPL